MAHCDGCDELENEVERLQEAADEAKADSERLDWYFRHHLDHSGERLFALASPLGKHWMLVINPCDPKRSRYLPEEYSTFREALDEAMRREKGEPI